MTARLSFKVVAHAVRLTLMILLTAIQITTMINIVAVIVLVGLQVISRLTGGLVSSVPDELISLSLVWMVFIAAAVLCKDDEHLRIEWIERTLRRWRVPYFAIRTSLELLFVSIFFYSALRLYHVSYRALTHTLLLPIRWWYLSLPVSASLMAFFILLNAGRKIMHKEEVEDVRGQELGRGRSGSS